MDYKTAYQSWLNDDRLCEEGKAQLKAIDGNEEEIEYSFGAELEFVCEPGADGLTANLLMTGPARIICRGELEADWLVG